MPFDWREYLRLAEFLIQNSTVFDREAALRCATSRAYYAAFCYARNYSQLNSGFIPNENAEDHTSLRIHLEQQGKPNIAARLDQLRQWRNKCDYENKVFQPSEMATNAIRSAAKVVDNLR